MTCPFFGFWGKRGMRNPEDNFFLTAVVATVFLCMLLLPAFLILQPLTRAAKDRRRPIQFSIADFLCLFLLVHLCTAPTICFLSTELSTEDAVVVYGVAWPSCGVLWLCSLFWMSNAGIINFWHRSVFLGLVLPVVVVSPGAQFGVITLTGRSVTIACWCEALLVAACCASYGFVRWMVAAAKDPSTEAKDTADSGSREEAGTDKAIGESRNGLE